MLRDGNDVGLIALGCLEAGVQAGDRTARPRLPLKVGAGARVASLRCPILRADARSLPALPNQHNHQSRKETQDQTHRAGRVR